MDMACCYCRCSRCLPAVPAPPTPPHPTPTCARHSSTGSTRAPSSTAGLHSRRPCSGGVGGWDAHCGAAGEKMGRVATLREPSARPPPSPAPGLASVVKRCGQLPLPVKGRGGGGASRAAAYMPCQHHRRRGVRTCIGCARLARPTVPCGVPLVPWSPSVTHQLPTAPPPNPRPPNRRTS